MSYQKDVTKFLRRGCRISIDREKYNSIIEKLVNEGFLEIEKEIQANCKHPDDYDYWDNREEADCRGVILFPEGKEKVTCPDCGREVILSNKREKQQYIHIKKVNYGKIQDHLFEIVKKGCLLDDVSIVQKGLIKCSMQNKQCYVALIHIIEDPVIFSSLFRKENRVIYIFVDSNINIGQLGPFDCSLGFLDVLNDPTDFIRKIESLLCYTEPELGKLQDVIDLVKFLGKLDKNGNFCEREVVPEFLDKLRAGHKKLEDYFTSLSVNRNNLLNQIVISVGGSYNIDQRYIRRDEYIQGLLQDNTIVDSKAFSGDTVFNTSELDKIERQFRTDPVNPQRAVVIVFNDRVSVWNELIKYREQNGYWKIIVINASLLSELIIIVDAIEWLQGKVQKLRDIVNAG